MLTINQAHQQSQKIWKNLPSTVFSWLMLKVDTVVGTLSCSSSVLWQCQYIAGTDFTHKKLCLPIKRRYIRGTSMFLASSFKSFLKCRKITNQTPKTRHIGLVFYSILFSWHTPSLVNNTWTSKSFSGWFRCYSIFFFISCMALMISWFQRAGYKTRFPIGNIIFMLFPWH